MRDVLISNKRIPSGYFKAIVQGQPDDHIMDWRGCNYHCITLKGQPKSGFIIESDADDWVKAQTPEFIESELERARYSKGTFLTD